MGETVLAPTGPIRNQTDRTHEKDGCRGIFRVRRLSVRWRSSFAAPCRALGRGARGRRRVLQRRSSWCSYSGWQPSTRWHRCRVVGRPGWGVADRSVDACGHPPVCRSASVRRKGQDQRDLRGRPAVVRSPRVCMLAEANASPGIRSGRSPPDSLVVPDGLLRQSAYGDVRWLLDRFDRVPDGPRITPWDAPSGV
jgi:hypothetical protein